MTDNVRLLLRGTLLSVVLLAVLQAFAPQSSEPVTSAEHQVRQDETVSAMATQHALLATDLSRRIDRLERFMDAMGGGVVLLVLGQFYALAKARQERQTSAARHGVLFSHVNGIEALRAELKEANAQTTALKAALDARGAR